MHYRITHQTHYIYDDQASLCYNEARLRPRSFVHRLFEQNCLQNKVTVEPLWRDHRERLDFFGNAVLYFTLREPHQEMIVTATSEVTIVPTEDEEDTVHVRLLARGDETPAWEVVRDTLQTACTLEVLDARQFVMNSPMISVFPELAAYAAPSFTPGRPIFEAVHDLMSRIFDDFDFVSGATNIATPLTEVLAERRGVCQDFAHLMLGCLRSQKLAARYISGYIETLPPPGQEKLQGTDASHAWCSVFIPDWGWIDFDPTNNLIPHNQHVTLAWGRDFSDVTPLKGVFYSNGEHKLLVSVDMARLD